MRPLNYCKCRYVFGLASTFTCHFDDKENVLREAGPVLTVYRTPATAAGTFGHRPMNLILSWQKHFLHWRGIWGSCVLRVGPSIASFQQCLFFNHVVKAAEMFDKGGMNNTVTRASVWLWRHCRHWISRKFQRLRGMTYHSLITWHSVQPVSIWGSACSWFMLLRISVTSRLLKRLHWFGIRSYKASMRL